jgi:hypothetical protein
MSNEVRGPLTILAEAIVTATQGASLSWQARRLARAAELQARIEERRARERRRRWREVVEKQMSRGDAGDATEAQARAALSGKRPNPLDQRKFR